jgi:methyltransferase
MFISRRHAARAFARGGLEAGQRHLTFMKLLHVALLAGSGTEVLWLDRPLLPALAVPMMTLALLSQALRYWAVATLGSRWNVRVIVVPGEPVVAAGPYRYLRHPNYVAVIVEGFALPLIHGAWVTAATFSVLNALLLLVRIRCEEQALIQHCGYLELLGNRPRLLPRLNIDAAHEHRRVRRRWSRDPLSR